MTTSTPLLRCAALALALRDTGAWRLIPPGKLIQVRLQGEGSPLLVEFGRARGSTNLMIGSGPYAALAMHSLLSHAPPLCDELRVAPIWAVSFERQQLLPPEWVRLLRSGGLEPDRGGTSPMFVSFSSTEPRLLNEAEGSTLARALEVLLRWAERPGDHPYEEEGATLSLGWEEGPQGPHVAARFEPLPAAVWPVSPPLSWPPSRLGELPLRDGSWRCALVQFSTGDGDETAQALLIQDQRSQAVVATVLMPGDTSLADVGERLLEVFAGHNALKQAGMPTELAFGSRRLFDAVGAPLDAAGVSCVYDRDGAAAPAAVVDRLRAMLDPPKARTGAAGPPTTRLDEQGRPDLSDLAEEVRSWKEADRALLERIQVTAQALLEGEEDLLAYFGDLSSVRGLPGDGQQQAMTGLLDWVFFCSERGGPGRTPAHLLREQDLPPMQQALLEAQLASVVSLYQVRSRRGDTVVLKDALRGHEVEVLDRGVAASAPVGLGLILRVYPAAGTHFISLCGMVLSAGEVQQAAAWLVRQGMGVGQELSQAHTHLFGRLWRWRREHKARA